MTQRPYTWVPPREGCLVINSGDQIAQLTNDVYRSAMHRVVTTSSKPRYSTAIFTYFGLNAVVAPLPKFVPPEEEPRYPEVKVVEGGYDSSKHQTSFALKNHEFYADMVTLTK